MNTDDALAAMLEALAAPFDPREVKFRAGATSGQRALALAYIDARLVQDRLDAVVGGANWQDSYDVGPGGSVVCRLALRLADEWITKMDVGAPSEQPDEGDRLKAAFSDALKRAAVKWGIARYLSRLPHTWVDYDPQKKQLKERPALPDFARPQARKQKEAPVKEAKREMPCDGKELIGRLKNAEADLVRRRLCKPGQLLEFIALTGRDQCGFPAALAEWDGTAITVAVEQYRVFVRAAEENLVWPHQAAALARMIEEGGGDTSDACKAWGLRPNAEGRYSLLDLPRARYEALEAELRQGRVPRPVTG